jgi:Flp pilus assembly protein TadB
MGRVSRNEKRRPTQGRCFNAALYVRLSHEDGDREESDSIDSQRSILKEFASHDEYIDQTINGITVNIATLLIATFVLLLAFAFVGIATSLWYIIPLVFGIMTLVISTFYVTCASWSKIYNKNKDKRLLEKKKKTENDTVVV